MSETFRSAVTEVTKAAATLNDRQRVKDLFLYSARLMGAMLHENVSEDEDPQRLLALAYADGFGLPQGVVAEFARRVCAAAESVPVPVFRKYDRPDDVGWAGWYEIDGETIGHVGLDHKFVPASGDD